MKADTYTIEVKSNKPFIVLDLKNYRAMLDQIEDMKDRLAIYNRSDDVDIPWEETEKKLIQKFNLK